MLRLTLLTLLTSITFALSAAEPFRFDEKEDSRTLSLAEGEKPIFSYVYDVIVHENIPEKEQCRMANATVDDIGEAGWSGRFGSRFLDVFCENW